MQVNPIQLRVSIRRASVEDATAVKACVMAAYAHWVPMIGTEPGPMRQDYEQVLAIEQGYVAESSEQVIGVLVLSVTDEGFLLENVAVHPSMVGTGLGRRLLTLAEQEALAQGFSAIHLYTHERMSQNIALYTRLGYTEYARRSEQGLARVYMRKQLR